MEKHINTIEVWLMLAGGWALAFYGDTHSALLCFCTALVMLRITRNKK